MIIDEELSLDIPGRTLEKEALGSRDGTDEWRCTLKKKKDSGKYLHTQRERCDRYVPNYQLPAFLVHTRLTSSAVVLADPSQETRPVTKSSMLNI